MRFFCILLLFVAASLAHVRMAPEHGAVAADARHVQAEAMACCDAASGSHGAAACSACATMAVQALPAFARQANRLTFGFHDWRVAELNHAPGHGPPRLL